MPHGDGQNPPRPGGWSRRRWLGGVTRLGLGAIGVWGVVRAAGSDTGDGAEGPIRKRLAAASLMNIRSARTPHYLGVGDAPEGFIGDALGVCEGLASVMPWLDAHATWTGPWGGSGK